MRWSAPAATPACWEIAAGGRGWSVSAIRYYAETGRTDIGRVMGPAVEGHLNYTLKLPLGVVVSIQPFNYPMTLLAWEGAAALAAGNAVITKPSEYTTITTLMFAEAFNKHLPPGLFQVLTGAGDTGRRLVEHPRTNMIAFTGSVPTGKAIAAKCGEMMKPSLIETSGNDPFIVMPSAPMDIVEEYHSLFVEGCLAMGLTFDLFTTL